MLSNSVYNHTRDKQITRMITDRIGLHSVLLPLLITSILQIIITIRNSNKIGIDKTVE